MRGRGHRAAARAGCPSRARARAGSRRRGRAERARRSRARSPPARSPPSPPRCSCSSAAARSSRLSWLDAAMGAAATAALAVALGAGAPAAVAIGGAAAGLGLSRWRPGRTVALVLLGLGRTGCRPVGRAARGGPRRPRRLAAGAAGRARPEFSPVVLAALLAYASIALTLLGVGQFTDIEPVAIALAIATVLVGMWRAGRTVIERLRDSEEQAMTDDLTGLGNRRHLVDTLHAAIESSGANGDELALLLIDLDGFKELNDTLGHHAGDEVLRQIGPRLKELLRERRHAGAARRRRVRGHPPARRRGHGQHRGPAPARRARGVVRGRRHPRPHRRQRRHRALPGPRAGRDGAAAARRRRHVPGQAHAHRPRGLPRRPRPPQPPAARAGRRAGRGARGRPARPALPAEGRAAQRSRARRRGARALGAPGARAARTRALPAAGRAERAHARADRVRARPRARGDRAPAPARQRPQPSPSTSARPTCSTSACRQRSSACSTSIASRPTGSRSRCRRTS